MKNILLLTCILLRSSLLGQVGTIKVKKPKGCDFKLIADKNLTDKKFEIGGVTISGSENSQKDDISLMMKTNLSLGQIITISHDTLEFYLRNICNTQNYKLVSVNVTKPFEQKNIFIELVLKDK